MNSESLSRMRGMILVALRDARERPFRRRLG